MSIVKSETCKLSLFQIEADIRALVEQRCDAQDRLTELEAMHAAKPDEATGEAIHAVKDELTTVDGLIRAYLGKEVKKVDSIAHVLLDLEARRQIHVNESARLKMLADGEEATAKRIKEMVLLVMDEFDTKILEGTIHDLKAQGSGGLQALTIAQPDMVPLELKRVTVTIALSAWEKVKHMVGLPVRCLIEEDTQAIRAALDRGEGVPGCRLEPRGKHLRIR